MAGLTPVELTADCEDCGLEGGVDETYDALVAACRFGIPASTRCKLCGASARSTFEGSASEALHEIPANRCPACREALGPSAIDERRCPSCGARATLEPTSNPARFEAIGDLERALDAWAKRERFVSREALARATFVEPDITKLFEALKRKERLPVLADPFANMGVRTTSGDRPRAREAGAPSARASAPNVSPLTPVGGSADPQVPSSPDRPPGSRKTADPGRNTNEHGRPESPHGPETPAPPRSAPPRAIVFPLVSVVAADGEVHPAERALVDRFLMSEGLAPLADHEFSVHHPSSVAHLVPAQRREEVIRLMCETAAIDGLPDESERRVIRAYATAWGIDDEKVEFWMWGYEAMNVSIARQLYLKLRRFVLTARWGDSETKD